MRRHEGFMYSRSRVAQGTLPWHCTSTPNLIYFNRYMCYVILIVQRLEIIIGVMSHISTVFIVSFPFTFLFFSSFFFFFCLCLCSHPQTFRIRCSHLLSYVLLVSLFPKISWLFIDVWAFNHRPRQRQKQRDIFRESVLIAKKTNVKIML